MKLRSVYAFILVLVLCAATACAGAELAPLPLDDQSVGYPFLQECVLSESEYKDESIHITIEKTTFQKTACMIARIKLTDPSQLRTIMANNSYNDTEVVRVNVMVDKSNSVLAINGDYFKFNNMGYLVRQSKVYRERANAKRDVLLIDQHGDFHGLTLPSQDDVNAYLSANPDMKVVNSFNFGPILVRDGATQPINTEDFQPRSKMQRIAIAQIDELSYAVFQCEGVVDQKNGLSLENFAKFIAQAEPNVKLAYNLDGGGSCQMFFVGQRQNYNPDTRRLCDMIYFCTLVDGGKKE